MTISPSKLVLKYAPWSYSKAEMAQQCPYKFYLTYIEKRKRKPNEDALVGQAVHQILEFMISDRSWKLSREAALEKYEKLPASAIDRIDAMESNVLAFIQKLRRYKQKHNIHSTWIEKKLATDLEGNPVQFFDNSKAFFRGIVDLAMFPNNTNHVILLDHKTGKQRHLRYHETQFDCYLLLMKAKLQNLEYGRVGIHWAKWAKVEFSKQGRDITKIQPYIERLIDWLNLKATNLENLKETRQGPLCNWCDFKETCPEYNARSKIDNACNQNSKEEG